MNEGGTVTNSRRNPSAGFLMMDLLLALTVMALIAALALPLVRAGSAARPRILAAEIASLLRTSRNAAILTGQTSVVAVDPASGSVRSHLPAGAVFIPRTVAMRLAPLGSAAIAFTGDGYSSGGTISLGTGGTSVDIRVNPVTSAVEVSDTR